MLDNLSTHSAGALYEAFPAPEAHRILRRLEFHYTPKHASWLNMVEIEIGVMVRQCLNRRIADKATLVSEIAHSDTGIDIHPGATIGEVIFISRFGQEFTTDATSPVLLHRPRDWDCDRRDSRDRR